jgi:WD40 repeat protein
MVLEVAFCP